MFDIRAAGRALPGWFERLGVGRPPLPHRTQNLWDHLSGTCDLDEIPHAYVLGLDQVHVVERGPRYCHPSYLHRIENGVRVQRAGASDVYADVAEFGDGYLGCEFTGYRPARLASADHSQTLA